MIQGAKECDLACQGKDWEENPALALALFRYLATVSRGVTAEVVMPYGDRLNSFGRWYAQLMAESLGKAKNRQGKRFTTAARWCLLWELRICIP